MPNHITTDELASQLHVKPQTIHAALSRRGHYFGLRPKKMPNRFLLWSTEDVQRLLQVEPELGGN
jgi:hypothetical protein